ncbi:MAG: M36 family metallopeptidase [Gaiellaceae bacterium]
MATLGALALPATAFGAAQIQERPDGLADYDVRAGALPPSAVQRAAVKRLQAKVSWNQFGTPASLSKRGKFLAKGVDGKNAAVAAERWLNGQKALFGLRSTDQLVLAGDTRMSSSRGHAVNFRQVVDGLATTEGGLVTIGITGSATSGWNVAYVSSGLTRDRALDGTAKLSAEEAWVQAANSVGEQVSVPEVLAAKTTRGWRNLSVAGMADLQRVKPVAFPTIRYGVVPAFETLVLKTKDGFAYNLVVDGRTGTILARKNLVENISDAKQANESYTFSGELPATDAACGSHVFAIAAGNRALDGFAAATVATNDVVLELWKDGVLLKHADTFFSPEQFRYEPAGGVAAGDYEVKVCDFPGGGGFAAPRTYTGTLKGDTSPPLQPYLARWKVFPANPPLHVLPSDPWSNPSVDTRKTFCWRTAPDCDLVIGNLASRGPWDHDHKANDPTLTTRGNNAKAATSWADASLPSAPGYMPTSTTAARDYSFPWTNDWFTKDCNPTAPTPGSGWDDAAAVTNLFVAHNRMHDFAYYLGFTEQNWNAQDYNYGLTEKRQENDAVIGNAQSGAQTTTRNNANMTTLDDGQSSITNMYFWGPAAASFYAPCVDGDYDMSIVGHEYGHMIENRMIGKGAQRSGFHAGAMGESFGDLDAMEYLDENGFVPTSDENPYSVGPYATGNKEQGIRDYALNYPMAGGVPEQSKQLKINSLNFSDIGFDVTGNEVHADGEIWSATNFRIRAALIEKYKKDFPFSDKDLQASCAAGELPPQNCPGNRRWIQLVYDAFLLMPTAPSMLQARDAQLAADLMRFGGANQKEIWHAFAASGFGVNATSSNASVNSDTDPTPDFKSPVEDPATLTFVAKTKDGTVITDARFFVGHYEARISPIADTNAATTGSANLDDTAEFVPDTYEFVATAAGYGHLRGRLDLHKGETKVAVFTFSPNYASAAAGATATGDGTAAALASLIDGTEATNWAAPLTITAGNITADGKKVTIDLAGTAPVKIKTLQVSAMLAAGNSRFSALRQFEVWACNSTLADCSTDAGYTKAYTSNADAFPGAPPRPIAPQLILRAFDIPDVTATHLRLVAKTSQCTGTPAFQGEQDADTRSTTDCDSNVPNGSSRAFVRAAEFQAFGDKGSVKKEGP